MNNVAITFFLIICPLFVSSEVITALSFGIGIVASYLYGPQVAKVGLDILDLAACSTGFSFHECCGKPWIIPNPEDLRSELMLNVFGQHIVTQTIPAAISAHVRSQSQKPLVLSFHGWTGGGKNYVASFIANNYYKRGERSKYRHFFNGRADFPFENKRHIYQAQLREWIQSNITECPYSMFIFDEVEKMPPSILDGIKPFLDHRGIINGVDYSKAIYIFLSNIGGDIIMERYLELWREKGKTRERMTLNDFDKVINQVVFNVQGGLRMSDIVDHNLVDHYIPFLPLERSHVESCIKAELARQGHSVNDEDIIKEVMKTVTFAPKPESLFAHAGCKRLEHQVRTLVHQKRWTKNEHKYNKRASFS